MIDCLHLLFSLPNKQFGGSSQPNLPNLPLLFGVGVAIAVYMLARDSSSMGEITWKEFVGKYLAAGAVQRLEVVNKEWVRVHLNASAVPVRPPFPSHPMLLPLCTRTLQQCSYRTDTPHNVNG